MTTAPTTPVLLAVRRGLLRAAYLNPAFQFAYACHAADLALCALADRDPNAAEELAAGLRGFGNDQPTTPQERALAEATALGLDTDTWTAQRDTLRKQHMINLNDTDGGPAGQATALWSGLVDHHPAIAAALAHQLRQLPDTWPEDLFQADSPENAIAQAPAQAQPAPEASPYNADFEDCDACAETNDLCRYHAGAAMAWRHHERILHLIANDPAARAILDDRLREAGQSTPNLSHYLQLLHDDDGVQAELNERLYALDCEAAARTDA